VSVNIQGKAEEGEAAPAAKNRFLDVVSEYPRQVGEENSGSKQ